MYIQTDQTVNFSLDKKKTTIGKLIVYVIVINIEILIRIHKINIGLYTCHVVMYHDTYYVENTPFIYVITSYITCIRL